MATVSDRHGALAWIQVLRGIAALAVVLWHASRYLGPYGTGTGGLLFAPASAMGVDLFFLISGFIMVHTTRHVPGTWRDVAEFAIKRATRIWPAWLLALGATLAIKAQSDFFTDPVMRNWLLHSVLFLPTGGAPADHPPTYGLPVLGVGWTLNYEMYFYASFAATLLFGRWRRVALIGWIIAALVLVPFATGRLVDASDWVELLAINPSHDHRYAIRALGLATNPLILLFVAGAVVGWIHHSPARITSRPLLLGLLSASVACVVLQYAFHFRTGHGLLKWGLSLVPLMLLVSMASKQMPLRAPRALTYLGDISFSLYLLHPLVQGWLHDRVARSVGLAAEGAAAIIVTTIASIAVAAMAHHVIERGLCEALKRRLLRLLPAHDDPRASIRTRRSAQPATQEAAAGGR